MSMIYFHFEDSDFRSGELRSHIEWLSCLEARWLQDRPHRNHHRFQRTDRALLLLRLTTIYWIGE